MRGLQMKRQELAAMSCNAQQQSSLMQLHQAPIWGFVIGELVFVFWTVFARDL